jgi:tRNA 2-thiouridine synthesizing protein A
VIPPPTIVLDARGLRCPVPVARTRARLAALDRGTVIEVVGDDPLLVLDMQAFCAAEGHDYLGDREEAGGARRLVVRKG